MTPIGKAWLTVTQFDMPVSFVFSAIDAMTPRFLMDGYAAPMMFFGIAGSAQYAFMGWALGHGIRRIRR